VKNEPGPGRVREGAVIMEGDSAASAGAMNAAVFAYGLAAGEREGAKKALAGFWCRVSNAISLGPLQPTVFDRILGNKALAHSPIFAAFDFMSRLFSPYELSPLNLNPLRNVPLDRIDFAALERKTCPINVLLEEARRAKDLADVRPLDAP
jgi:NTE family protein